MKWIVMLPLNILIGLIVFVVALILLFMAIVESIPALLKQWTKESPPKRAVD